MIKVGIYLFSFIAFQFVSADNVLAAETNAPNVVRVSDLKLDQTVKPDAEVLGKAELKPGYVLASTLKDGGDDGAATAVTNSAVAAETLPNSNSYSLLEQSQSRSKWRVSYFAFSSANQDNISKGSPSISNYMYLSFNYKLSKDSKFAIRPAIAINSAGYDDKGVTQEMKTVSQDLHMVYTNYKIWESPSEWTLWGDYKFYLPTSDSSKEKRMQTRLSSWTRFEKEFQDGWNVGYNLKPDYYVQSQKAYRQVQVKNGQTFISARTNKLGTLDHYLTVAKRVNSVFTPALDVGLVHEWYHMSDQVLNEDPEVDYLKIAPTTEIHVHKNLWFILGFEDKVKIGKNEPYPILGRHEDLQWYLMTFASFSDLF